MTKQKILTTRKLELTIHWGNAISKQNFLVKKSSNKIKFSERVLAVRHFAFCYKTKSDAIDRWKLIVLNEKKKIMRGKVLPSLDVIQNQSLFRERKKVPEKYAR